MKNKIILMVNILALGLVSVAAAAVPNRINFQGKLLDASKNPQNGTFSMTFRICDTLAASCASPIWTETQGSVSVANGVFSVQLGDSTDLTDSVFSGATTYLEIDVAGETLSPRERLVTSPYTYHASIADDVVNAASRFILSQNSLQQGTTFYVSSGTINQNLTVKGVITAGSNANTITTAAGLLDATLLTGLVPNVSVNASSVTKQGNVFNGANQLLLLDGAGNYPAIDGSAITGIDDATKLPLAGGTMTGALNFGTGSSLDTPLAEISVSTNISATGYVGRFGFFYARRTTEFDNAVADAYTQFDLDTQDVLDAEFYSEAAGVVTILKAGLYLIDTLCTFDLDSGNREDGQCAVFVNGGQRNDLTCSAYTRETGRLGTSCSTHGILNLGAGDTVDLRMQGDTVNVDLGGGVTPTDPATLRMEFIR